ncbi:zinc-ribbon domain-containing protein [Thermodesulfobacteriota bacterium]
MIVFCEDCGRKYRIDPERMDGRKIEFSCESCGHMINVSKPGANEPGANTRPAPEITEEK